MRFLASTVADTSFSTEESRNQYASMPGIEDFEPDQIVQQVEPLRKLVEARQKLSDLISKMDGNDKLESLLSDVLANADKQKELSDALGLEGKEN